MGGAASGAGMGALIGSVVPGVGTAIGAAVGGGLGFMSDMSGNAAARAAGDAANAQLSEAQYQRAQARQMTEGVTVDALAHYDRAIAAQERSLARQEEMIKQIDPVVLEASQQALKLMRGEQSSTLQPLQNQRNMQRQKILNQLREQLGPGAETSTMGMMALNRFDSETANLYAGAQQQALGNMGSIFSTFNAGRPSMINEAQAFGNLASNRQAVRLNQVSAMSPSNQAVYSSAGAPYVSAMMQGQQQQSMYNSMIGGATQLGSAYLMSGAMKKA